jgi:two-component system, NarL family, invasion response regulator UvrY
MPHAFGEITERETSVAVRDEVPTLVVDDQEAFRDALRDVVCATPGFTLAGEAASGEAALAAVGELSPLLVLMDVRMPGIGGIEATRALSQGHPNLRIVLISVENRDELPAGVDQCGAVAFVRKQELRPQRLHELWAEYGTKQLSRYSSSDEYANVDS